MAATAIGRIPMRRPDIRRATAIAAFLLACAESSGATVIVDHVYAGPAAFTVGSTFQIDVRLRWDGEGALRGVFASTFFDSAIFEYVSSTPFRPSILAYADLSDPENPEVIGALSRLGGLQQPGDPANLIRSVQYGGIHPSDPRAATTGSGILITRLTLRVIGAGNATWIGAVLALGDTGAVGDELVVGSSVCVWSDGPCDPVPEAGTALSIGLGLAGLSLRGRRLIA